MTLLSKGYHSLQPRTSSVHALKETKMLNTSNENQEMHPASLFHHHKETAQTWNSWLARAQHLTCRFWSLRSEWSMIRFFQSMSEPLQNSSGLKKLKEQSQDHRDWNSWVSPNLHGGHSRGAWCLTWTLPFNSAFQTFSASQGWCLHNSLAPLCPDLVGLTSHDVKPSTQSLSLCELLSECVAKRSSLGAAGRFPGLNANEVSSC